MQVRHGEQSPPIKACTHKGTPSPPGSAERAANAPLAQPHYFAAPKLHCPNTHQYRVLEHSASGAIWLWSEHTLSLWSLPPDSLRPDHCSVCCPRRILPPPFIDRSPRPAATHWRFCLLTLAARSPRSTYERPFITIHTLTASPLASFSIGRPK
ncbi:hypothetical protein BCV69DRAFT_18928 [Microstroma glucosiphilum]|uniref:Uncharacterized protein n=1 Tax=Pseudomicrostroma glucosiphilum TaxID=1684307 RepID=A0A316UFN4_9BASI|nr:hypothetical protein BCV69DRAFT_18928 [Pseudomicrostroma glucosiphilum]PWN24059.1 hypothetical protein BCV69DRAFT_18928 [Pseudomicrostroma glucosiphilum]